MTDWTIEQIEAMSDAEYAMLPHKQRVEIANIMLETLVSDGVAYKGEDGRYRIREDVTYRSDGVVTVSRPN